MDEPTLAQIYNYETIGDGRMVATLSVKWLRARGAADRDISRVINSWFQIPPAQRHAHMITGRLERYTEGDF